MINITVITHVWNESAMLPYFIRHYRAMEVDRIIVFVDRETNDHSREICNEYAVECRESPCHGLDDAGFVGWANREYQTFRGETEWLLWPDCDEMIWHVDGLWKPLKAYARAGIRLLKSSVGWNMVSEKFPTTTGQIYDEVKMGLAWPCAKPIILKPEINIEWSAGKHNATGEPTKEVDDIQYLHFRLLGLDYCLERNHRNWKRINEYNRKCRHGWHVSPKNDYQQTEHFKDVMAKAVEFKFHDNERTQLIERTEIPC